MWTVCGWEGCLEGDTSGVDAHSTTGIEFGPKGDATLSDFPSQNQKVEDWVAEEPQRRYLLRIAKKRLAQNGVNRTEGEVLSTLGAFLVSERLTTVIHTYQPTKGRLLTYVGLAFCSFCQDEIRKERRVNNRECCEEEAIEVVDERESPLECAERAELIAVLNRAIAELPPADIAILRLHLEEASTAKIASVLDLTNVAVRKRLQRIRCKLEESLRVKKWSSDVR